MMDGGKEKRGSERVEMEFSEGFFMLEVMGMVDAR